MSPSADPGFSKSGTFPLLNARATESPLTVQVNDAKSDPARVQAFASAESVSVTVSVSTAVVPSEMLGVVSDEEYVGVWSFRSVTVTW